MKKTITLLMTSLALIACGQTKKDSESKKESIKKESKTKNTENKMDLSKITNENVRQALEALQANDKNAWYGFFTSDAIFSDDGNKGDFKSFFDNAFNHKEKFLAIDKIENDGKDITGDFFAGQWGTFKVFFKFHQNSDGKFDRIDIGQAK